MVMRTSVPVSTRGASAKAPAAPRIQRTAVSRPSLIVRRATEEGKNVQDIDYHASNQDIKVHQANGGQTSGDMDPRVGGRDKQREAAQWQESQEGQEGRRDQVGQSVTRGLGQTEGGAGSRQSSAHGQEDASQETLLTHPETFAPDQEGKAPSMMEGQQERKA